MHVSETQPLSIPGFSQLGLKEPLLKNLESLEFKTMTPIQERCLPHLLKGDDIIARANTGSGKTVAFGLTILNGLNLKLFAVQALVLCPTRELAEQVSQVMRQLARQMPNVKIINLSGGLPMKPQLDSLRHGAHIIIGTPGRVQKHLDSASLVLDHLNLLTLDEADRMLDMGFFDAIHSIVQKCPKNRQTLLFSATYPPEIKSMSQTMMKDPKEVFIEEDQAIQQIEQKFYEMDQRRKPAVLIALLKQYKPSSALIFCNTKQRTTEVMDMLMAEGFSALALNGDMEQVDRDLAIIQFTNKSCSILVATDVAARGLDIKELPLVINYELAFEPEVHTHRIGRTGRAGNKGLAITLTTVADAQRICALENVQQQPVIWSALEEISFSDSKPVLPQMMTLCLDLGKKDKVRAGDILGALTKEAALPGDAIGKIDVLPLKSYVAINKYHYQQAIQYLKTGKIKGLLVKVVKLGAGLSK